MHLDTHIQSGIARGRLCVTHSTHTYNTLTSTHAYFWIHTKWNRCIHLHAHIERGVGCSRLCVTHSPHTPAQHFPQHMQISRYPHTSTHTHTERWAHKQRAGGRAEVCAGEQCTRRCGRLRERFQELRLLWWVPRCHSGSAAPRASLPLLVTALLLHSPLLCTCVHM